jgi:virginiamycin B lyase
MRLLPAFLNRFAKKSKNKSKPQHRSRTRSLGARLTLECLEERQLLSVTSSVVEFNLPAGADPQGIVQGPDGNFWITEAGANRLAKMTPTGGVTESQQMLPNANALGITRGGSGDPNVYFTEYSRNVIGQYNTGTGAMGEAAIIPGSGPTDIVMGNDGALYWLNQLSNTIGAMKFGQSATLSTFTVPTNSGTGTNLEGITIGPDKNLWFTEFDSNILGRVQINGTGTYGTVTEFQNSANPGNSGFITTGPDGALYWTNNTGRGGVGSIDAVKPVNLTSPLNIADYPLQPVAGQPGGANLPTSIVSGGVDGRLYFGEQGRNAVAAMNIGGVSNVPADVFPIPITSPNSNPGSIAVGPNNTLAVIEQGQAVPRVPFNKIAVFTIQFTSTTTVSTVSGQTNSAGTSTAVSGCDSLTATVVSTDVTQTGQTLMPSGSVTFIVDGNNVGSAPLAPTSTKGTAIASFLLSSALTPGTHTVKAQYVGDANFQGSSGQINQAIVDHNKAIVDGFYHSLLGRDFDTAGEQANILFLQNGGSPTALATNMMNTAEYRTHIVNVEFQRILHRAPNSAELAASVSYITPSSTAPNGNSDESLEETLMTSSTEFYINIGGNTAQGFLDAVYRLELGRPVDQAGLNAFQARVQTAHDNNNAAQLLGVVTDIMSSSEFAPARVKLLYRTFLLRPADPVGINDFLNAQSAGKVPVNTFDEFVIARLVGSVEYCQNVLPNAPIITNYFTGPYA